MKTFFIYTNPERDLEKINFNRVCKAIEKNGAIYVTELPEKVEDRAIDAIIVLGGDGTLIRAAEQLNGLGVPLMGINVGTLGYLTTAESSDIEMAVERLVNGDYSVENRMMLDVSINGGESFTIINEAVFSRSGYSKIINLEVFINNKFIYTISGDGLLIASPTGSTGYNLSAGGGISVPWAEVIHVTPICPHSISSRGLLASADDIVKVKVVGSRNPQITEVVATLDGNKFYELNEGDIVEVKKSSNYTSLISINDVSFFDKLREKLSI